MKWNKRLTIIGVLLLVLNMVIATQYATTKIGYEYYIVHPSDADIRYIGSDNTTGGRVLRVSGVNGTSPLKLSFGNWSADTIKTYSAAFGIVNEEDVPLQIKYINVSSANATYLKIWLHGNPDANANSTSNDPTTVLMYNNGTIVNDSSTTAWTLAAGNNNASNMCSNVSNRTQYNINTTWDESAHVRFSIDNTIGYGVGMFGRTTSNASDYVWIQIAIDIPEGIDASGYHSGTIWIHLEADTS